MDQEVSAVLPASESPVTGKGRALSRAGALRALAGGGVAAAGLVGFSSASAAPSRTQDQKILNYLLVLERLQAAFYASARRAGGLSAELQKFAAVVGRNELEHVRLLSTLLGAAAKPAPAFHFGSAVSGAFARTAVELEEAAVGAYIATGASLTDRVMADVGSICAVEGRHAAWIRSIAGVLPAPAAADPAESQQRVLAVVRRFTR